ncbi:proteasome assembly chaperone 4 isoform X1 [Boleophthalmus pectinirostris]|uniref:proteasome assembly chaperone 4 isoform X1 n=1 Tax=Boleophthalmus pectinirostris TaxID=150288 RepID=UPI00242FF214|nr:proteasome assembly chaperone 4 isoform X1 [Boleophthalmus pectinirostris]
MSETENSASFGPISVHNFSEKILEQVVHFHVMKLNEGFFLWIGSSPVLSNLAVSMPSKYDSMPLSSLVMGDPSNTAANTLAQRLGTFLKKSYIHLYIFLIFYILLCYMLIHFTAKRTKKQVFVSYSLAVTDGNLSLLVENRIKKELELHPEWF